ncbi:hypothetical protein [Streptosporangium sp. NPDC049644]
MTVARGRPHLPGGPPTVSGDTVQLMIMVFPGKEKRSRIYRDYPSS